MAIPRLSKSVFDPSLLQEQNPVLDEHRGIFLNLPFSEL